MERIITIFAFCLLCTTAVLSCGSGFCNTNEDFCSGNCQKMGFFGYCMSSQSNNGTNNGNDGNDGSPSIAEDGGSADSVTEEEFCNAVTSSGFTAPRADQFEGFKNGLSKGEITTKREAAMALAQIMHESKGLTKKEEERCAQNNCAGEYGNQGCEVPGQYYCGRGYIQLTWCYNYKAASQDLGHGEDLLKQPDLVASNEQYSWETSFWFWNKNVHNGQYGQQVQSGQFGYSTRAINGKNECNGAMEEESKARFRYYQNAYRAFGIGGDPIESGCYN